MPNHEWLLRRDRRGLTSARIELSWRRKAAYARHHQTPADGGARALKARAFVVLNEDGAGNGAAE